MIGNSKQIIQWILNQEENKIFSIKEYTNKRTLNQNAYCWELIQQMANILRLSKEEVYLEMLKNYGQSTIISVRADIPYEQYFKYCEEIGTGVVNGQEFKHLKIYKGSSEFDKKEMQIFLDGICRECENLGIHTLKGE